MTASENGTTRVLLIGPMPPAAPTAANPVGGAAVNFAETTRQLQQRGFDLEVVDITRPRVNLHRWRRWRNNLGTVLRVICRIIRRVRHNEVVFLNMASGKAWLLASCIWVICTWERRPLVLRLFGGDFADIYHSYTRLVRWLSDRTYMQCALVFVQTQEILSHFYDRANMRWFANTRDLRPPTVECRKTVRRLLFVSQLRTEKGLAESLEACRDLPADCHLNVYGPRMANTDFSLFDGNDRATYSGVLSPSEVPQVLAQHDVLLLPSYFDSEGYPGIILEALQCGKPVISTWWKSIPEVVEHEKSGLLVEPRSAPAVKDAILRLLRDPELYQSLCSGARARGEFFRSGVWYDRMAADLCHLAEGT